MRGTTLTLQTTTDFFIEECCDCGVLFAMTAEYKRERQRDHKWFYCPNGHQQHYTAKSDAQLRREAEQRAANAEEEARIAHVKQKEAERLLKAAEAEAKRQANRAKAGVCPCCNRSFVQLARHMKSKHPEHAS